MKSKKSFFDFIKALLVIALILVAFVACRAFFEDGEGGSVGGIGSGNGNVTESETVIETETEPAPEGCTEHEFIYYPDLGFHICKCGATDLTEHTYSDCYDNTHYQYCDLCGTYKEDHVYTYTVNADGTHTVKGCICCEYDEDEFIESHEFEYNSEANQYICWCGFTVDGFNVEWPGVTILGPQDISPYTPQMGDWGILAEDGMVYRHIFGVAAAISSPTFGATVTNGTKIQGGRYLVFKIRCDSSLNNMSLVFENAENKVSFAYTADGWTTFVFDMSAFNKDFYKPDVEGNYPNFGKYMTFNTGINMYSDRYFDFAYFAVCEDAIGVLQVTGEDQLQVYTADNTSTTMTAEDFSNAYVFLNETESETEAETEPETEVETEIETEIESDVE